MSDKYFCLYLTHQTFKTWKIMSKKWTVEGSFDISKSECHYIKNSQGERIFSVHTLLDGKDNVKRMEEAKHRAHLVADAPTMLVKLSQILGMYAKGIKPSIGMINEIESLIQKHQ